MKLCRICGKETNVVFNIDFRKTPICESCANSITWQQIESLIIEKKYAELTGASQSTEAKHERTPRGAKQNVTSLSPQETKSSNDSE